MEIVDRVEGCTEGLAGDEEVPEVGARVASAGEAEAGGVDRSGIGLVFFALDVHADDAAGAGLTGVGCTEEQTVTAGAGWEDAVHHVDAHAGVLRDFVGIADAHDVAGFVGG